MQVNYPAAERVAKREQAILESKLRSANASDVQRLGMQVPSNIPTVAHNISDAPEKEKVCDYEPKPYEEVMYPEGYQSSYDTAPGGYQISEYKSMYDG